MDDYRHLPIRKKMSICPWEGRAATASAHAVFAAPASDKPTTAAAAELVARIISAVRRDVLPLAPTTAADAHVVAKWIT